MKREESAPLEGQTSIPQLGRPPAPKFGPENSEGADPFRAKHHKLPFSLPGPLAMMLGPNGGEQVAEVMDALLNWGHRVASGLTGVSDAVGRASIDLQACMVGRNDHVLRELLNIRQELLNTQRELVRVQAMAHSGGRGVTRSVELLVALANDDEAWEVKQ